MVPLYDDCATAISGKLPVQDENEEQEEHAAGADDDVGDDSRLGMLEVESICVERVVEGNGVSEGFSEENVLLAVLRHVRFYDHFAVRAAAGRFGRDRQGLGGSHLRVRGSPMEQLCEGSEHPAIFRSRLASTAAIAGEQRCIFVNRAEAFVFRLFLLLFDIPLSLHLLKRWSRHRFYLFLDTTDEVKAE